MATSEGDNCVAPRPGALLDRMMAACGWRCSAVLGGGDSLPCEEFRLEIGSDGILLRVRHRLDGGVELDMRCGSASAGSRCFGEDGDLADCLWLGVSDIRDGILEQQSAWHRVETVREVMEVAGRRLSDLYVMRQAIDQLMSGIVRIAMAKWP